MTAFLLTIRHGGVHNLTIDAAPTLRKLRRRCRFAPTIFLGGFFGTVALTALRLALCSCHFPDLIVVTAPALVGRWFTTLKRFLFGRVTLLSPLTAYIFSR